MSRTRIKVKSGLVTSSDKTRIHAAELLAPEYEAEDSFALMASEYNDADWYDFYNYGVYMGWF